MSLKSFTADKPLVLLGCGNMGRAMMKGWLKAGLNSDALFIIDPVYSHAAEDGVSENQCFASASELDLAGFAGTIVLALKPQIMAKAAPDAEHLLGADTMVMSVAAGIRIDGIAKMLPGAKTIVRAMPNTPAAIGAGMTGLYSNALNDDQKAIIEALMASTGKILWVAGEQDIDMVTAVSGSGPAYVFHMVEALAAAGEEAGLSALDAELLARQTIVGAAQLLAKDADVSAASLREQVTSPGGTTAAGLSEMMATPSLTDMMTRVVQAAKARSEELAG